MQEVARIAPGKRSRVQARYGGQTRGPTSGGTQEPDAPARLPELGIDASSGGTIPHRDRMEAAFGEDLGHLRAHTGTEAQAATGSLGATAFAYGNQIAFNEDTPGEETVAHEIAHTKQQAGGISLENGQGQPGDVHEREAESIAAKVGQGESVDGLLPPGGAPVTPGLQLEEDPNWCPAENDSLANDANMSYPQPTSPSGGGGSYPGADESLDRQGVAYFTDEQIQTGITGTKRALAELAGGSSEYDDRHHNLLVLEWEAHQRRLLLANELMPTTHGRSGPGGIVLFTDRAYTRSLLEGQIASGGIAAARDFVGKFERIATGEEKSAGPVDIGSFDASILSTLRQQLQALEDENTAFVAEFTEQSRKLAFGLLDESEVRVQAEMQRYGMSVDRKWGLAGAGYTRYPETNDMQAAAGKLLASQRKVKALQNARTDLGFKMSTSPDPNDLDDDLDADIDGGPTHRELGDGESALLAEADEEIAQAELEHAMLRTEIEAEFPALSAYQTQSELARVCQEHYGLMQVAWDLDGNLLNIAKTREAIRDGDLHPLRLEIVVDMMKQHMMVVPDSMRDRVLSEATPPEPSILEAIGIAILTFGLGLLAAIPTAGASLGVAAGVATATVAGLALEGYLVYDAIRDYKIAKAAAGTDPDKARALSQGDPSLFWLAVDIVAAGLGGGAALKTFRDLANARRASLTARSGGEFTDQLGEIKRLQLEAGLPDEVGDKLQRQVAKEHPDPHISGVATTSQGRQIPELAVARRNAYDSVAEDGGRWKVEYRVKTDDGQDIWLGDGIVSLDDTGVPVEYPHFNLDATTTGANQRAVHIYDDVVDGAGTGERLSFTRHAIDTLTKRYHARFGHPPEALKGTLAWSNKLNFQKEFHRLTAIDGLSPDAAAVEAVKRISFGRHRAAAGFGDFEVTIRGTEGVNIDGYGIQRVPKSISVVARRTQ